MAYSTRSGAGSRGSSEAGDNISTAEMEIIQKRLIEKEKMLQEQAQALQSKQAELKEIETNLNKEKNAAVGIEGLTSILNTLTKEISNLKGIFATEISTLKELPEQIHCITEQIQGVTARVTNIERNANLIDTSKDVQFINPPVLDSFARTDNRSTIDNVSPIRFKDVIDSIPRYDGHKMSVFQFSKICERALKLISPQQEPYLIELVINKLQGHAYTAIEGMTFHTLPHMINHLKRIFGPNKSLNQYRGELGNLYMMPNEDIFNYVERAKNLRAAIIDGEVDTYGSLLPQDEDRIDHDILESFINGLPSDLLVRVKLEGRTDTLDNAITSTIQLTKTLEAENKRKKGSYHVNVNKPFNNPRVDYATKQPNSPGKTFEARNTSTPFTRPLNPGQPGPNSPVENICRYCKTPGHLIDECRKLAYRRATQNSSGQPPGNNRGIVNINPGNASRISEIDSGSRDANQTGRRPETKIVRFQEPTTSSPASRE